LARSPCERVRQSPPFPAAAHQASQRYDSADGSERSTHSDTVPDRAAADRQVQDSGEGPLSATPCV